jgi:1,3-propanediol dehydrogenase
LVDPTFTMTAPPAVTANTGLDALCHAIEAYTSRKAQPLTDSFALSAIRKIHHNLPLCYQDGKNVEARLAMSLAALEAGIAFNNASGYYRAWHEPADRRHCSISRMACPMRCCCRPAWNLRLQRTRPALLISAASWAWLMPRRPDKEAALAMAAEVARFCKSLAVPTLAEKGVKQEDFFNQLSKMADDALESGSPQNTMRIPTKEQIMAIYRKLF